MPKAEDTFCIFDINLRQHYYTRNIIEESLQMCNIFKINDEELAVLNDMLQYTDMSNAEVCNTILKTYNLKALILTCGTNGSFVFTDDEVSYLETPEVDVADTVGAGDSFTAAFIASILKGNTIREAHREAVRISAYVCTRQGAMPF